MSLKSEVENFIRMNNKPLENLERDIEIILHFFGFGNEFSPTLESTANTFGGLTRERVRQIIEKKFRKYGPQYHEWKYLHEIASKLKSEKYISGYNLSTFISRHEEYTGLKGTLNLLNEVYLDLDFFIYDDKFERTTKHEIEEIYLIDRSLAESLRSQSKQLMQYCGRDGIICLQAALETLSSTPVENEIIKFHFKKIETIKIIELNDKEFYLAEGWNNVIENSISKIFATGDYFTLEALAAGIFNSFSKRPFEIFNYPSIEVINKYLNKSSYISKRDNSLLYSSNIGKSDLSDGEKKIFDFLALNPYSSSPEIREHLKSLEVADPFISKLLKSPFIFEDKEEGRTYYKYSLLAFHNINKPNTEKVEIKEKRNLDHLQFKLSLISGQNTDLETFTTQRAEQATLRLILFSDTNSERCGICSKLLPTNALVAAHKKKRSECEEHERLDFRIVMPMCKLGCDFLYESGFIGISDGKIVVLRESEYNEISSAINLIQNRDVDSRWLDKSENYFDYHNKHHLKKGA